MVVQHNISAMNAERMLGINSKIRAKSTEKLSSGYKINRAADDASGLAVSEKMRRQIRGLGQAVQNAQDGISMVQIADGAMAEIQDMLLRGMVLSVQASNGTLSQSDRNAIQMEIDQLRKEIDGIAQRTLFNETKVLQGEIYPTQAVVGEKTELVFGGQLPAWVDMTKTGSLSEPYTNQADWTETWTDTAGNTQTATGTASIDHAAAHVDFSKFDGSQSMVNDLIGKGFYTTCCTCSNHYSIRFTSGTTYSTETSGSQYIFNIGIEGAKDAGELIDHIVEGTRTSAGNDFGQPAGHYTLLIPNKATNRLIVCDGRSSENEPSVATNGGTVSWSNWQGNHKFFNTKPSGDRGKFDSGVVTEVKIPISEGRDLDWNKQISLQIGADSSMDNKLVIELPYINSRRIGIGEVDVTIPDGPEEGIDSFAEAIENVSRERSRMGAYQNRLEHTVKNLDNVVENTVAAESRIRDTDMAEEMVLYSGQNILQQAGQSVLAQANQQIQAVLSLLQ